MEVKTVFIAHPLSGNLSENARRVRKICKELHSESLIPYAPYLVTLQYLDDNIPDERLLGIIANYELFYRRFIDELWLFGDHISRGMTTEVILAQKLDIPIIAKTKETARHLKELLTPKE